MIMTFIEEAVIGEFISKVSDSAFDISKVKIKQAVENRKNKHQSPESQMYNIVVDVLNKITYGEYENDQDKIYDAAEKILKGFKSGIGNSEDDIKLGLNDICENVDENKCTDFMKLIYRELSKENYSELYREIRLLQKEEEGNKTSRIERKLDVAIQKIDYIRNNGENVTITQNQEEKFQNNKKDKYLKIWNSRLFLHIDNEERPITLADAFIMPDYNFRMQVGRIKFLDTDTIGDVINKFIKYDATSNMLITGAPGIGKTSITAWIANEYKDDEDVIILRFRDWGSEELDKGLLKAVCETLKCEIKELENKILIVDGFDEIKSMDNRDSLLNRFLNDILDFDNFKIIVTSRPNYLDIHRFQNVFELLAFEIDKISQFYEIIKGVKLEKLKIDRSNLNVIGIPVILYMAIMSDVDLTQKATKPELYSRIFAEEGGIFDKFCYEGIGYDKGNHILRDRKNVKKYLRFLGEIAFKMFEKNDLILNRGEYEIPELSFQGVAIQIMEFPIKYVFDNTESTIEFIHKSLYEYFVSEYICFSICQAIDMCKSKEDFAGILGKLFKDNILSSEILEFLKFNVLNEKLENKFDIVREVFQIMIQDGMTFYTRECYSNIIECEMTIFFNMLEILHALQISLEMSDRLLYYIKYNRKDRLNLREIKRENIRYMNYDTELNLDGVYLKNVDLSEAKLYCLSFKRANLQNANFTNCILKEVDFSGADLRNTIFDNVDLNSVQLLGACFNGAVLKNMNLREIDLNKMCLLGIDLENVIIGEHQIAYLKSNNCDLYKTGVYFEDKKMIMPYREYKKSLYSKLHKFKRK